MLFAAKTAQGALPSHPSDPCGHLHTERERERDRMKGREMCRAVDAHSEAFTTGYVESNNKCRQNVQIMGHD